jgi:predicted transglutaminase-like cysteine proteinase
MKTAGTFAVIALGTILCCAPLHAESFPSPNPGVTPALPDGGTTAPPPGFVGLCMHNPSICAKAGAGPDKVVLTEATQRALEGANTSINVSIAYETDEQQFGVANVWSANAIGGHGDCKDYALAKRELLIGEGLSGRALRIAIVRTPQNELHAVLTVDTDRGDLVLDSATSDIKLWWQTSYRWLSRQSADDPLHWVQVAR